MRPQSMKNNHDLEELSAPGKKNRLSISEAGSDLCNAGKIGALLFTVAHYERLQYNLHYFPAVGNFAAAKSAL